MKMNNLLYGLFVIFLAACTENSDIEWKSPSINENLLRVEVCSSLSDNTRANYSGFPVTTFETGDAIGIYAFDGTAYVSSNAKYVKQSDGTWLPDSEPAQYNVAYAYYAYYPWRSVTYTPSTSGTDDDVDIKFSDFISDASNYFWQVDQSTKTNFTKANLMIAKGGESEDGKILFRMNQKRGLAILAGEEFDNMTYEGNIPYLLNGKHFFLMKPNMPTIIGGQTFEAPSGEFVTSKRIPTPASINTEYLTFTALEDGTFTLTIPSSVNTSYMTSVSYSLDDGNTWVTTNNTNSNVTITTPTVTAGNKVLWKGTGKQMGNGSYSKFSSTNRFEASGNIMSLLYGDDFADKATLNGSYNFQCLFYNCTKLTTAPDLPATTLTQYCYQQMFYGCSSLTTAPDLPATTLANYCYSNMFNGCTSLTTAPELPATSLAQYCYQQMFYGCSSLTTAPELPATSLAQSCYYGMFYNCTNLTTAPELPATTLTQNCYSNMFNGCTALTTAPALPAMTLAGSCYQQMFYGCSSLTTAPELPATSLAQYCYNSMFNGCTNLTTAPELPATTLVNNCYNSMFKDCTKIEYIKAAFTTTPTTSYTNLWVSGVKSTGTFVKNSTATWDVTGTSGIPSGWTVNTYTP